MEEYIKVAADSVETLRRLDCFRVLAAAPDDLVIHLARWIGKQRPDLREEINSCLIDLRSPWGVGYIVPIEFD